MILFKYKFINIYNMVKIVSWNVNGIRSNIICKGSFKKIQDLEKKLKKVRKQLKKLNSEKNSNEELNQEKIKELEEEEKNIKKIHNELSECNLKELIDKYDPDIICFQETKCSEEIGKQFQFPEYPFKYWNESKGEKHRGPGYSGTSIWSKIEPEFIDNKYVSDDIDFINNEGRFLMAKFEEFDIINVYVPNSGTNYDYRIKEWDKNIHNILMEYQNIDKPLVYTGDLNVVSTEKDIWNPQTLPKIKVDSFTDKKQIEFLKNKNGLLIEERDNVKILINDLNYLDVFRHLKPDIKNKYTWWDQRSSARTQNKGRRIDYFLIFNKYIEIIKNTDVLDDIYGSDHCPIILEIL